MPAFIKTQKDEKFWGKAKRIAHKEYNVPSESDRFYKIVTGIYKKMKGGTVDGKSKTASVFSLLKPLFNIGFTGSWIGSEMQSAGKAINPGKYFNMYKPLGSILKTGMKKEAAPLGMLSPRNIAIASAIITGSGIAASTIPVVIQKIVDHISANRSFNKAYQEFPDLKLYDKAKIKSQFSVIKDFAPNVAKNPYLLGSLLRQTGQYDAADKEFIDVLTKVNERITPVGESIAKAIDPYIQNLSKEVSHAVISQPPAESTELTHNIIVP